MTGYGVRGIRVAFGNTVALDDVTLEVPTGRVTAVVGGDGAGKSTLLRVLAGRVGVQAGSVRTVGKRDLGYQPSTSGVWGSLTVAENLAFVGQSFAMPAARVRSRGDELLERAGLSAARDRLGRDLSGGMRQKLGFVLAILHDPRLVLLDEPSTGVDPVSRVELWRLIAEAATEDTAVLLATTYLDEASRAMTLLALDGGRVIGAGTPDDIIASVPGRIVTSDATAASPDSWRRGAARHRWIPPEGGEASPGAEVPVDLEDALIALTLAREGESPGSRDAGTAASGFRARGIRAAAVPAAATPALTASRTADARDLAPLAEARAITRRFEEQAAVEDVSLCVGAGEIVGLIGANGAGKTTLLRMLIGLERPDEGEALLFGAPPAAAARRRLGYVPQGLGLAQSLTVAENVAFVARVYRSPAADLPPALAAVAEERVADIGLGRQRQLAFALALAHRPELLVLDEPTSGVDPLSRARLWDTIHAQADAGIGVIVTTHYLQEAEQCTRLALMSQGRLTGTGTVAELTAGMRAVEVRTAEWQRALAGLTAAGLPTMLSGRNLRVAGVDAAGVEAALGGIPARCRDVPPTLEEAMVLREQ